jgi:putative ABC transport system permease protein
MEARLNFEDDFEGVASIFRWSVLKVNALLQDIRYGIRVLAKKPLVTVIAALSLAVGIGLNTAIFTLTDTILWGSLPYRDADRLVSLSSFAPGHPDQLQGVSIPDLFAWKQRARSFESIGVLNNNAYDFGAEQNGVPAERLTGEVVTPSLLEALGTQPIIGRLFTESEDEVDHPAPVILISYRLWMGRFGGDKDILHRKILVNGAATTVVGVMPRDFRITDETADWLAPIPINHFQLQRSARFTTAFARLKPGVTVEQAQSEMDAIAVQLADQFPDRDMDHGKPWMVRIRTIREAIFGFIGRPLLLLQVAVGFVLLIACANVAALLLARASSRRTEVAIRAALGAGRRRIVQQFLTESVVLSMVSGILGIFLAWGGVRVLVAMAPSWLPRLDAIRMNGAVLTFSAAISVLTGLTFGAMPAAQGSKSAFVESLKDATRGGTADRSRHRLRAVLVAGQLALALMLLIGAGLLIRSFLGLEGADLGCDPHGLLTFRYRFGGNHGQPIGNYHGLVLWEMNNIPTTQFQQVFERLETIPGARSVAGAVFPPLTGNNPVNFTIDGKVFPNPDDVSADFFPITPNFFATMKIAILRGRDFTGRDTAAGLWVAIINETMARRYFAGEDPIGKRIRLDLSPTDPPREVIAVVRDIPASNPQTRQDPAIFTPVQQLAPFITGPYAGMHYQMTYLIRILGEPMAALPAVRQAVEEIDRNRPLIDPRTEDSYLDVQAQYPRYYSMLLGLFAAVATGLAAVGIYGVMAYAVEQRTREIGIRIALGAAGWDVFRMIAGQALIVIALGVAVGLAGAISLTRFLSSEIWEVRAGDPATFAGVTTLLMAIAVLACIVPARRAVRVEPTTALRYE